MTIREYFDNMAEQIGWDETMEMENTMYACYETDDEDFTMWAVENGIDLTAIDETSGEYVFVLWCYDMCGD